MSNDISDAVDLILKCDLNDDSIWFRKSTTFSLIVELIKFKNRNKSFPETMNLKAVLGQLEDDILTKKSQDLKDNKFAEFYKFIYSGTASRTARVRRGSLLEEYLK